jgi:hypothetical protein
VEFEYVWRQQDMRALRRALFWRDHTIRLYAALFVLGAVLAVLVHPSFALISLLLGASLTRSALGLVLPWRPLAVETTVHLRVGDAGLRFTQIDGDSRSDLRLGWSDVVEVKDLRRHVVIVTGGPQWANVAIPRRAFASEPSALTALHARVV